MLRIKEDSVKHYIKWYPYVKRNQTYHEEENEWAKTCEIDVQGYHITVDERGLSIDHPPCEQARKILPKEEKIMEIEVEKPGEWAYTLLLENIIVLKTRKHTIICGQQDDKILIDYTPTTLEELQKSEKIHIGAWKEKIEDELIHPVPMVNVIGNRIVASDPFKYHLNTQAKRTIVENGKITAVLKDSRGEYKLPVRPGFMDIDKIYILHSKRINENSVKLRVHCSQKTKYDRIIPGVCTKLPGAETYYNNPRDWIIKYRNKIFTRSKDQLAAGGTEKTPTFQKPVQIFLCEGKKVCYYTPELITGQTPLAARRITKKKLRLYYLVTPEGIFTGDVPMTINRTEPLSADDLEIIATHAIFPARIKFNTSSITLENDGTRILIGLAIDDRKAKLTMNALHDQKKLETVLKETGHNRELSPIFGLT